MGKTMMNLQGHRNLELNFTLEETEMRQSGKARNRGTKYRESIFVVVSKAGTKESSKSLDSKIIFLVLFLFSEN